MNILKKTTLLIAIFATISLSGCIGDALTPKEDPTCFYIMRTQNSANKVKSNKKVVINLSTISVPTYMSRTQMVSLNADSGTVLISEFSRWAESPQSGFSRVIAENIRNANPNISIFTYPEISTCPSTNSLRITITECIGTFDGNLEFKGRWTLMPLKDSNASNIISKEFSIIQPCGKNYKSYVESINNALSKLCDEITLEISKK